MRNGRDGTNAEGRTRVSRFAWRLEREWRALGLPVTELRVVVAVSGGPDSTALLLAMNELAVSHRLGLSLVAAHLDHDLRGEAGREDAAWLSALTLRTAIPLIAETIDVGLAARSTRDNLEQSARRVRYEFLARTAARTGAGFVVTGHTMDDQAETVLLRLMRGSGLDGLGGMRPVRPLRSASEVRLVRPFLSNFRRAEILEYCRACELEPRHDGMNSDPTFARVAVRQQLLPVMERFNPRIVETLVRSARLLQDDAVSINADVAAILTHASRDHAGEVALSVPALRAEPLASRIRVIRSWLELHRHDLRRIEAVHLRAAEGLLSGTQSGRVVEMPGGGRVERQGGLLLFKKPAQL